MSEKKPATRFRVWSVFSFVFAGFDTLGLVLVIIAWVTAGSVLFSEMGNWGIEMLRYSTGVDIGTVFNLIMLAATLICVLHISIDIHTGLLLRRPVRRKKAPYIIYAIRDIIMTILNLIIAIFFFMLNETATTLIGICYLLPAVACAISVIMLFMRAFQDELAMSDDSQQLYNITPPVFPANVIPPFAAANVELDQPKPFIVPEPTPVPAPAPLKQKAMGSVRCTEGVAKGQGFRLPEERKVVVGKSPQRATLVINNPHISNVHCSIRYHVDKNIYIVKDHSTNGTFVSGVRLQREVAVECPAGTVLSLADGENKITLG